MNSIYFEVYYESAGWMRFLMPEEIKSSDIVMFDFTAGEMAKPCWKVKCLRKTGKGYRKISQSQIEENELDLCSDFAESEAHSYIRKIIDNHCLFISKVEITEDEITYHLPLFISMESFDEKNLLFGRQKVLDSLSWTYCVSIRSDGTWKKYLA